MNEFEPHRLEGFERKGKKEAVVDLGSMNGEGIVRFKFIETEDRKPKINAYSYESVKDRDRNNFVLFETEIDEILPIQSASLKLMHKASEIAARHDLVEKAAEVEKDFSEEVDA